MISSAAQFASHTPVEVDALLSDLEGDGGAVALLEAPTSEELGCPFAEPIGAKRRGEDDDEDSEEGRTEKDGDAFEDDDLDGDEDDADGEEDEDEDDEGEFGDSDEEGVDDDDEDSNRGEGFDDEEEDDEI